MKRAATLGIVLGTGSLGGYVVNLPRFGTSKSFCTGLSRHLHSVSKTLLDTNWDMMASTLFLLLEFRISQ